MNTTNARGGPSLPSIRSLHPYLPPAPSTAPAPSSLAPPVSRTPPPHAGPSAARDHDRDYDRDREHEEARGTLPPFSSYPVEESDGDGDERDSMPEPPKKKRRRQPLSCTECKRRKIKCDRSQPCGPCSRRGDQAKCRWHIVEPATDKYVPRSEFEALRARVDTLEDYIRRLPGPGPASSTFGGTAPTGFFPQAQMQSPDTIHPPAEMLMGIAAGPYPAPPGPSAHDPGLAYSPIQSRAPLPARVGYMPMPMPPPAGMPPHHLVLLDSSPFPSSPGYRPGHARSRSFGEGTRRPLSADGDASPPGLTVPHSAGPSASSFDLPLPSGPPPSSAAAPDSRVRSLSPRERARRGEHGALPPLMGLGPAPGPGPGPPPPSSSSSSSRHGDVGFHPYRAEGGRHRATSRAYDPAREAGSSSSSTSASRTAHTQRGQPSSGSGHTEADVPLQFARSFCPSRLGSLSRVRVNGHDSGKSRTLCCLPIAHLADLDVAVGPVHAPMRRIPRHLRLPLLESPLLSLESPTDPRSLLLHFPLSSLLSNPPPGRCIPYRSVASSCRRARRTIASSRNIRPVCGKPAAPPILLAVVRGRSRQKRKKGSRFRDRLRRRR